MEHASYSFEAFARALVYIPAILFLGSISYRWTYLESEQEAKWLRRLALWAASVIVLAIGLRSLAQWLRRLALWAASVIVLAIGRSLAHDYAAFGEDAWSWESLRLIVIESRWGQRWRWQLVAAIASVMSLALVYVAPKLGWVLTSLSGLGLCFSLPLTGHAMVLGTTTIILQAAHVAGAGIWMGTLSVLFLAFRRDPTPERFRKLAPIATTGALLVGVSGTVTAWHALPDLASLWQSAWGRLLAAKLALVVGIGGCGFFNWRHFRAPEPKGSGWITIEVALAVLLLVVTGWLAETGTP